MGSGIKLHFISTYKLLGIYQIIGSIIGFILLSYAIYNQGLGILVLLALDIVLLLFCIYSFICGVLCLKMHDMALSLSFVNQVLQLISFAFGGYLYSYISGINFSITLDFTNELKIGLDFGISKMLLKFNNNKEIAFIHINLVALGIMIFIDRIQQKIKIFKRIN